MKKRVLCYAICWSASLLVAEVFVFLVHPPAVIALAVGMLCGFAGIEVGRRAAKAVA